jgi:hypothetical protein
MSRMPASTVPTCERRRAPQPKAMRIRKLTEVSSRKSILSANSDRADGEGYAELDPEIGKIQESHAATTRRKPSFVR